MRYQTVEIESYPYNNKHQKKVLLNKLGINRKDAIIVDKLIIVCKERMEKSYGTRLM